MNQKVWTKKSGLLVEVLVFQTVLQERSMSDDYEPLVGDDQGLDYLGSEFTGP